MKDKSIDFEHWESKLQDSSIFEGDILTIKELKYVNRKLVYILHSFIMLSKI